MDFGENIWDVDWDEPGEYEREAETAGYGGVRGKRLRRQLGAALSSAVWELDPGATQSPYHFHHGGEELLIVLRGSPTLRSPEGDRELKEGEVVHFPRGQEGAHQVSNRSSEVARYVIAASQGTPEIVEYPDSGKIAAMARTETSAGGPLFTINRYLMQGYAAATKSGLSSDFIKEYSWLQLIWILVRAYAVDYYDGESA